MTHLSLFEHHNQLDTYKCFLHTVEVLESEDQIHDAFYQSVILLYDVFQVFALTDIDPFRFLSVVLFDYSVVGTVLINID